MSGGRGVDDTEADGMSRELLTLIIIICCRIVVVWYMLRSHSHCPVCVFSHCSLPGSNDEDLAWEHNEHLPKGHPRFRSEALKEEPVPSGDIGIGIEGRRRVITYISIGTRTFG